MFFNFEVKYVKDFWSHWPKKKFGGTLRILEPSQKIYLRITAFWPENGFCLTLTPCWKCVEIPQKMTPKWLHFRGLWVLWDSYFSKKWVLRKTVCRDLFGHKQSPKKFWHQKNASSSQKSKNKTVFLKTRLKIGYLFRDFSFRIESFGFVRGWKIGGWWKNRNSEKCHFLNSLKLCQQKLMWKN